MLLEKSFLFEVNYGSFYLVIFSNSNKLISLPCLTEAIDSKVNWRGDQLSYGLCLVTRRQSWLLCNACSLLTALSASKY
jgi:hypothetical protein